jgi:5-(carboxyamino)imidazole ribonucleotide mutase
MGSDSDFDVMQETANALAKFGVPHEVNILSAHRSPDALMRYVKQSADTGVAVFIAAAGGAAHLAGVVAAQTTLPVIGVPIASTSLNGLDSLLAMVQMPGGVPVATVAVGKPGALNAALLAVQILALSNRGLGEKLKSYKKTLSSSVDEKNKALQKRLGQR